MIERFVDTSMNAMRNGIENWLIDLITTMLQWSVSLTGEFWSFSLVSGLVRFCVNLGRGILIATFLVVLFDIVEDVTAGRKVFASTAISNLFKAMAFVELAPRLGQYSLDLCDRLVVALNLKLTSENTVIDNVVSAVAGLFAIIIAAFACGYFLFQTLKRFGTMLIQVMTSVLYVPSIIRGDTTAMGSWLRQTISIALTFFFQYFMFYLGITLIQRADSFLIGIGCWASMGMIPRILDKYGLSSGTGGGLASVASTGLMMLAR